MTALTEYQRLESPAVWRPEADAQRREVFVSVGDATLTIFDTAARTLGHWSLPAVIRMNPGELPAIYVPGADAPEELEIEDETMIDAIERVGQAIRRRRPQPGRLRLVLLGSGLATVLALTVFWLPDAVIRHAATVVPPAKSAELGDRLLSEIERVAGSPCNTVNGPRGLDQLKARLMPDRPGKLVVLADGIPASQHLPGGTVVLNRRLVEDYEDPAVVAGFILAELARAEDKNPVLELLEANNFLTAFRLLTTGEVPDSALQRYAEQLLSRPPQPVADSKLLARFAEAGVPATPYAYAVDISGETTLGLIEADPGAPQGAEPILTDGQWVSLQGICGE